MPVNVHIFFDIDLNPNSINSIIDITPKVNVILATNNLFAFVTHVDSMILLQLKSVKISPYRFTHI